MFVKEAFVCDAREKTRVCVRVRRMREKGVCVRAIDLHLNPAPVVSPASQSTIEITNTQDTPTS